MMTGDKKKYILIISAVIVMIGAIALLSGNGEDSQAARRSGPEGVLTEFTAAMKGGDFEKAAKLCSPNTMEDYLDTYIQKWNTLSQKDSAAFSSITHLIREVEIHFNGIQEEDGVCMIDYALEMGDNRKEHKATLRKEEGEWKIAEITNKH